MESQQNIEEIEKQEIEKSKKVTLEDFNLT